MDKLVKFSITAQIKEQVWYHLKPQLKDIVNRPLTVLDMPKIQALIDLASKNTEAVQVMLEISD